MKGFLVLFLLLAASAANADIYTWKDARGTSFYTNSLQEIPARYLRRARVLDVATGKKGALVSALPATSSAPAASPGQPQQAAVVNPATNVAPALPAGAAPVMTPTAPPVQPAPAPTIAAPPAGDVRAIRRAQRQNRVREEE